MHIRRFLLHNSSCILGSAAFWQPDKMGVYEAWFGGSVAGRKVWKHSSRQNYIYFWEWGVNTGSEWMIGLKKQIGFYENEKINQTFYEYHTYIGNQGGLSREVNIVKEIISFYR